MMIDVTPPRPIMISEIEIDELLIADVLYSLEARSEIWLYLSCWTKLDQQLDEKITDFHLPNKGR